MHHLGIPTTRALSLVGTGDTVYRDMFYKYAALVQPSNLIFAQQSKRSYKTSDALQDAQYLVNEDMAAVQTI